MMSDNRHMSAPPHHSLNAAVSLPRQKESRTGYPTLFSIDHIYFFSLNDWENASTGLPSNV